VIKDTLFFLPPFLSSPSEAFVVHFSNLVINTNALNILTPQVVIASPKGVAISFFMGLLRRPAKRGTSRNDKLLIAFVLEHIDFLMFFDILSKETCSTGGSPGWKWVQKKRSKPLILKERSMNALPVDIRMDFISPSDGIQKVKKEKFI